MGNILDGHKPEILLCMHFSHTNIYFVYFCVQKFVVIWTLAHICETLLLINNYIGVHPGPARAFASSVRKLELGEAKRSVTSLNGKPGRPRCKSESTRRHSHVEPPRAGLGHLGCNFFWERAAIAISIASAIAEAIGRYYPNFFLCKSLAEVTMNSECFM